MKDKPSSNIDVESLLLAALQAGRWKAGDRLPTTAELAEETGADLRSVQRALAALAARGLLDRRPRLGTYVRESAAPRTIGLVTGWNLKLERNAVPRLFVSEIERALAALGYRLHLFENLFSFMVNDATVFRDGVARLHEELTAVAPAGFVELQMHLGRLPGIRPEWELPTVHAGRLEHGADAAFDRAAFYRDAMAELARRGCRRVVLIRKGALLEQFPAEDDAFFSAAKKHRFLRATIREVYVREQSPDVEGGAAALLNTLAGEWATARRSERPDALLLADDVMMRGVVTALLQRGLGSELTLLTLTTSGLSLHFGLPVIRYEIPVRALAEELAHRLHLKLARQPLPKSPALIAGQIVPPEPPKAPLAGTSEPLASL